MTEQELFDIYVGFFKFGKTFKLNSPSSASQQAKRLYRLNPGFRGFILNIDYYGKQHPHTFVFLGE